MAMLRQLIAQGNGLEAMLFSQGLFAAALLARVFNFLLLQFGILQHSYACMTSVLVEQTWKAFLFFYSY
jgi:hypothetical protein